MSLYWNSKYINGYCNLFSQNVSASLFFRAQRIFLHNARGWFGDIPLEASGDFGIDPEEGEYQLMCQVVNTSTAKWYIT